MKIYATHRVIHLEAVLIVALIAVARSYYLVRRSHREESNPDPGNKG